MTEGAFARGFHGLARPVPSLPVGWYADPAHHARELGAIWRRSWLAFCRADAIPGSGASPGYCAARIAGMNVLVVRGRDGRLAGFHNVCRHRGAELCAEGAGALDRPLLTCPYHAWTYDLTGRLVATGHARRVDGFDRARHRLVPLGLAEWGGLVFVNADGGGQAEFDAALGPDLCLLDNWPLAALQPVHTETTEIACNWKVFWENFNECLHCPGIHRDLSDLVPIYGRGIMVREDDPGWRARAESADPRETGGLRAGAESWTADGRATGPTLPGLSPDDVARGHTYAVALPSLFVVGHVDHARAMRILPLGPERTLVEATWLIPPGRPRPGSRPAHRPRPPRHRRGRRRLRDEPARAVRRAVRGGHADAGGIRGARLPRLGARAPGRERRATPARAPTGAAEPESAPRHA